MSTFGVVEGEVLYFARRTGAGVSSCVPSTSHLYLTPIVSKTLYPFPHLPILTCPPRVVKCLRVGIGGGGCIRSLYQKVKVKSTPWTPHLPPSGVSGVVHPRQSFHVPLSHVPPPPYSCHAPEPLPTPSHLTSSHSSWNPRR